MSLLEALDTSLPCPISWLPYETLTHILAYVGAAPSVVLTCSEFKRVIVLLPVWDSQKYFRELVKTKQLELLCWYFNNQYRLDSPTLQYLVNNTIGMVARDHSDELPMLLGILSGGTLEVVKEHADDIEGLLRVDELRAACLALAKRGSINVFEVFRETAFLNYNCYRNEMLAVAALNGRYRMLQYLRGYERVSSDVYKRNPELLQYPWHPSTFYCAVKSGSTRMIGRLLGYNQAGKRVYSQDMFRFNISRDFYVPYDDSEDPEPLTKPLDIAGVNLLTRSKFLFGSSCYLLNTSLYILLAKMGALNCLKYLYDYSRAFNSAEVLPALVGYPETFKWLYLALEPEKRDQDRLTQAASNYPELTLWLREHK